MKTSIAPVLILKNWYRIKTTYKLDQAHLFGPVQFNRFFDFIIPLLLVSLTTQPSSYASPYFLFSLPYTFCLLLLHQHSCYSPSLFLILFLLLAFWLHIHSQGLVANLLRDSESSHDREFLQPTTITWSWVCIETHFQFVIMNFHDLQPWFGHQDCCLDCCEIHNQDLAWISCYSLCCLDCCGIHNQDLAMDKLLLTFFNLFNLWLDLYI